MKNIIVPVLLIILIVVFAFSSFRSCSSENKVESYYKKQQVKMDSLISEFNRSAKHRIDSVKIIEKHLTILEKEKTEQTNEIYNVNNIDSVIVLYKHNRPD